MRFLHVIRSLRCEAGGPAEGLRLIAACYLRDGHAVEIATLDATDAVCRNLDFPVHTLGRKTLGYGYSGRFAPWLRHNAHRFDGIVVHGLWQYHGLAALLALKGRHRYAIFPHGMLDPWFNRHYPWKRLKKLPYWLLTERRLLAGAQAVLFTSSAEARLARGSFPLSRWRSEVVPYGTLGPPGDPVAETNAFYERVPAVAGRPYLLFAGRMHEKKGCDLLLRAYGSLHRQFDLPVLVMAGPDEAGLTGSLQRLASRLQIGDKVLWPGMLTGEAKWGAFRAAEAFVLPSHQENFGIAVAEALSCGTPVLISHEVNIHGEVSASGAGLVEPDTLEGTTQLLRRWLQLADSERKQMRVRARQCWANRFDSSETSSSIARLFAERRRGPAPQQDVERRSQNGALPDAAKGTGVLDTPVAGKALGDAAQGR